MDDKPLKNLLRDTDSALGALAGRAATMVALRERLASSLPDELGDALADAAVNADNVLIVTCTSAGFPAARCRVGARPVRP